MNAIDHDRLRRLLNTDQYSVRYGYWISSTQPDQTPSKDFLANQHDGYWVNNSDGYVEWSMLGQDTSFGPGSSALNIPPELPYTTRLRPMNNMDFLAQAKQVVVVGLDFRAYDHRLPGGTDGQSAATYTEIDNSISGSNLAYWASRFRGGQMGDWLNNWFRPSFRIGGLDLLRDLNTSNWGKDASGNPATPNLADQSVGWPLPYSFDDMYAYFGSDKGAGQSLIPEVNAQCVQYIDDGVAPIYKRYPIRCVAHFVVTNQ